MTAPNPTAEALLKQFEVLTDDQLWSFVVLSAGIAAARAEKINRPEIETVITHFVEAMHGVTGGLTPAAPRARVRALFQHLDKETYTTLFGEDD